MIAFGAFAGSFSLAIAAGFCNYCLSTCFYGFEVGIELIGLL